MIERLDGTLTKSDKFPGLVLEDPTDGRVSWTLDFALRAMVGHKVRVCTYDLPDGGQTCIVTDLEGRVAPDHAEEGGFR